MYFNESQLLFITLQRKNVIVLNIFYILQLTYLINNKIDPYLAEA